MKYLGNKEFSHDSQDVAGILLVNLGTPDAPDRRSVRRYLKQFLSDPRVIEYPRWLWWPILNGIILNVRPARSARAYRQVWTESGSPLMVHSTRQLEGLRKLYEHNFAGRVKLELAMTYGTPSIEQGLERLRSQGLNNLVVLPLYPQYSATTTGSVFDQVTDCLQGWRWLPSLRFIHGYHDHPAYIGALAKHIRAFWSHHGQGERLLISFHGLPRRYLDEGDPYYCQCHKTARLLSDELGLGDERWGLVFQSRFGREEWLKPYCDQELRSLARAGVKSVDIICPGFASDCLETLEEIGLQYRQVFLDAGGDRFNYIPCLNDDPVHIRCLAGLIDTGLSPNAHPDTETGRERYSRARSAGARA